MGICFNGHYMQLKWPANAESWSQSETSDLQITWWQFSQKTNLFLLRGHQNDFFSPKLWTIPLFFGALEIGWFLCSHALSKLRTLKTVALFEIFGRLQSSHTATMQLDHDFESCSCSSILLASLPCDWILIALCVFFRNVSLAAIAKWVFKLKKCWQHPQSFFLVTKTPFWLVYSYKQFWWDVLVGGIHLLRHLCFFCCPNGRDRGLSEGEEVIQQIQAVPSRVSPEPASPWLLYSHCVVTNSMGWLFWP